MDYYQIVFIVAEIAVWVNQLDSDLGSREESQEAKLESLARCLSYSLKNQVKYIIFYQICYDHVN